MKYFIFLICLFLNNCATLRPYRDNQLETEKTKRLENVFTPARQTAPEGFNYQACDLKSTCSIRAANSPLPGLQT